MGLAALAVIHIVYAFWLTMQNRAARGTSRYEVVAKPAKVEWASQNMLVLGIIVLLGLLLHFWNFWYNMMFAELVGLDLTHGFWSAMQTFGWNGKVWFNRWKTIGTVYSTLLILGFLVVVIAFALGCAPSLCC